MSEIYTYVYECLHACVYMDRIIKQMKFSVYKKKCVICKKSVWHREQSGSYKE